MAGSDSKGTHDADRRGCYECRKNGPGACCRKDGHVPGFGGLCIRCGESYLPAGAATSR